MAIRHIAAVWNHVVLAEVVKGITSFRQCALPAMPLGQMLDFRLPGFLKALNMSSHPAALSTRQALLRAELYALIGVFARALPCPRTLRGAGHLGGPKIELTLNDACGAAKGVTTAPAP